MLCLLNLNLPFANTDRSDSVSDQHSIFLHPSEQMGALVGAMGAFLPSLYSHPKILKNTSSWTLLLKRLCPLPSQPKEEVQVLLRPNHFSAEPGEGSGIQAAHRVITFFTLFLILQSCTGCWVLSTAAHYMHCGWPIAKRNLQCNPNLSIETPSSQCSKLAVNTALHSRHY